MRLTLRTLLAWLDDTLPPSQVREIGKQVSESSFARELVERIHRVTRQRRYTVPNNTGPDSIDPNIVASYVDNDLESEQVADYEKKCLTSDVRLAEVACVHQILSLLGQKVHVPPDAKSRMYQLVKGRESIPPPQVNGAAPRQPEPVTKPIQPWVAPEPAQRHWIERFGPVAACLSLIGILSWSAYLSLSPVSVIPASDRVSVSAPVHLPSARTAGNSARPAPGAKPDKPAADSSVASEAARASEEGETQVSAPTGPVEATEAAVVEGGQPKKKEMEAAAPPTVAGTAKSDSGSKPESSAAPKPAAAVRTVPAGAVGVVDRADGVLVRFNVEKRDWERLSEGAALASGDRILSLAPFRARLVVAQSPVTLVGETVIRLTGKNPADPAAFELVSGRAIVEGTASAASLKVEFADHLVSIEKPSQGLVGLERKARWAFGHPPEQPAPLAVHTSEGDVALALDTAKETLSGPGTILAESTGRLARSTEKTLPAWMTERDPTEKDSKPAEQFLKQFSADRPVLSDIVVASESESPVVRKFAIMGVKAMGDLSLLTPILSRANDPSSREGTASALRAYLAEGPQAAKRVREGLDEEFGTQIAQVVEKLLIGYTPAEAARPETLTRLVDLLSPRDHSLAVRELALDNLKTITGRDGQGYDPDNPDEKGHNAWKGLLNKGELKPASSKAGN